jgi:hypothetical protein
METADYLKLRLLYHKRADQRSIEKLNTGMNADEDVPYYVKVTDEMLIDLMERVAKIEKLYAPAPEVKTETDEYKSRLRLG